MYHLTPDQYDAFSLAALNLHYNADDWDKAVTAADELMAYTAMITGKYSDKKTFDEALIKAKELPYEPRKTTNALIKHFIGSFTYDDSQAWREPPMSKTK